MVVSLLERTIGIIPEHIADDSLNRKAVKPQVYLYRDALGNDITLPYLDAARAAMMPMECVLL